MAALTLLCLPKINHEWADAGETFHALHTALIPQDISVGSGDPAWASRGLGLPKSLGRNGVAALVERHCQLARHLAALVGADPGLERLAPVELSIVCFRLVPKALAGDDARLNARPGRKRASPTPPTFALTT